MSQADKERYQWYKSHGICVRCGKEKADKGRTRCLQCRFIDIDNARKWQAANKERITEYNKKAQRERRESLKAQGLCQICAKPSDGRVICRRCAIPRNIKQNEKRHANGVMPRDMMGDGEYCFFCGQPVKHKGDKSCSACHKRNADIANSNRLKIDYMEHKWRKAEMLSFERRKQTNGT